MKKKDFWIIGVVLVLALLLFGVSRVWKPAPLSIAGRAVSLTMVPDLQNGQTDAPAAAGGPTLPPSQSYLRIKQGKQYFELIPLLSNGQITLHGQDGQENVVEIGPDSAVMHSANCKNQDCVKQGKVTLINRDMRVLYNQIICLPNEVSLELLSRAEALALRGEMP